MRISLNTLLLALLLHVFFPSVSPAAEYEYKDYKVKKGDTLWKITKRHLKDPFDWPMVWKENTRINNPDRIYPGQVIRIPVALKRQTVIQPSASVASSAPYEAPAPEPEAAPVSKPAEPEKKPEAKEVETKRVVEVPAEQVLSGGYISKRVPRKGEISGSLDGRRLFGRGDEVYIKSSVPVSVGKKFYVINKGPKVKHPVTDDFMGYLITINGTIEVTKIEAGIIEAKVLNSFNDIDLGSPLDEYYDVEPVLLTEPPRPLPGFKAVVAASLNMRRLSGLMDVIFIDKGGRAGLEPGDMLVAVYPGTTQKTNGILRVINTREDTATAIVMESISPVSVGETVIGGK